MPRYVSVANALAAAIARGRYPVGSMLPIEHDLCDTFGVSRFTVREALRQLRDAGLVKRKPRTGTVVIADRPQRTPYAQTLGSVDDLLQYAVDTQMRLVHTGRIEVGAPLARDLPLPRGQSWVFVIGIRYKQNDPLPVCLTRVYINPEFRHIGSRIRDRTATIYNLIEKHYGVSVARVEQRIHAVSLSRDDAVRLNARPRTPALRTVRLYYDAGDRLVEISDSIHPGDRFTYAMTIRKNPRITAPLSRAGGLAR